MLAKVFVHNYSNLLFDLDMIMWKQNDSDMFLANSKLSGLGNMQTCAAFGWFNEYDCVIAFDHQR